MLHPKFSEINNDDDLHFYLSDIDKANLWSILRINIIEVDPLKISEFEKVARMFSKVTGNTLKIEEALKFFEFDYNTIRIKDTLEVP